MKNLRILFTILSALCIAAVLPMGALFSWTWAGVFAVFALAFYGLMRIFKGEQEKNTPSDKADYLASSKDKEEKDASSSYPRTNKK